MLPLPALVLQNDCVEYDVAISEVVLYGKKITWSQAKKNILNT